MFRLLIAVAIVGALAYWMLRPHGTQNVTAAKVQPMLQTLKENGCPPSSGSAALNANASAKQSLQALKQTIESCEQRAARRDGGDTSGR